MYAIIPEGRRDHAIQVSDSGSGEGKNLYYLYDTQLNNLQIQESTQPK
jgi:hypothetical protein